MTWHPSPQPTLTEGASLQAPWPVTLLLSLSWAAQALPQIPVKIRAPSRPNIPLREGGQLSKSKSKLEACLNLNLR